MYLAYFDESGDAGIPPTTRTRFFVLSCVLVHEAQWLKSLDRLVSIRHHLGKRFGLKFREELKASDFRKGQGPFAGLGSSRATRYRLFTALMRLQEKLFDETHVFAVAIQKSKLASSYDVHDLAWQLALERVDTFCRKKDSYASLFPDEGLTHFIRRKLRMMRRYHRIGGMFGGVLDVKTKRIVEDPNERNSKDSFFIQMADWDAYAAHRSRYLDPLPDGSTNDLWDALGGLRLTAVNSLRGGPPAIVVRP